MKALEIISTLVVRVAISLKDQKFNKTENDIENTQECFVIALLQQKLTLDTFGTDFQPCNLVDPRPRQSDIQTDQNNNLDLHVHIPGILAQESNPMYLSENKLGDPDTDAMCDWEIATVRKRNSRHALSLELHLHPDPSHNHLFEDRYKHKLLAKDCVEIMSSHHLLTLIHCTYRSTFKKPHLHKYHRCC